MVFNLISAGIFGKTDQDSIEDFKAVYDFQDAFAKPYAPEKKVEVPKSLPAPKLYDGRSPAGGANFCDCI